MSVPRVYARGRGRAREYYLLGPHTDEQAEAARIVGTHEYTCISVDEALAKVVAVCPDNWHVAYRPHGIGTYPLNAIRVGGFQVRRDLPVNDLYIWK